MMIRNRRFPDTSGEDFDEKLTLMVAVTQKRKELLKKRAEKEIKSTRDKNVQELQKRVSHVMSEVDEVLDKTESLLKHQDALKIFLCSSLESELRKEGDKMVIKAGDSKQSADALKSSISILVNIDTDASRQVSRLSNGCEAIESKTGVMSLHGLREVTEIEKKMRRMKH